MRSSVVLPQPDGPTIMKKQPVGMSSVIGSSATKASGLRVEDLGQIAQPDLHILAAAMSDHRVRHGQLRTRKISRRQTGSEARIRHRTKRPAWTRRGGQ